MKQKSLLYLLLLMGMVQGAMAQEKEPYAVLSDNDTKLTLYYDTQEAARNGKYYEPSSYRSTITTVVFDASFADCTSLTSTAYWFEGCSNLTTIIGIENLKTDNVTSMLRMFNECSSLKSLDVTHFNTEKVTVMDAMFRFCSSLESLDLSNFNTENVEDTEMMFAGCSSLKSLDVSNFNTSNMRSMGGMFSGCSSLTHLDVSSFTNVKAEGIGGMFGGCSSLTTLDLSNFNTSNVTDMDYMFWGCTSLKTIYADGAKWNTDNVTKGGDMFTDCTSLVGGNGTAYDASHTDHEYARIDKAGQPGYLTQKGSTGIENLSTAPVQGEEAWYTLDGRRVETPTKGINVKNGRKVVVK